MPNKNSLNEKKPQVKKAFSNLFFVILFLIFITVFAVGFYFVKQFLYQKKLDSAIVLTKSSPVNYVDGAVLWLETVNNINFVNKKMSLWFICGKINQKDLLLRLIKIISQFIMSLVLIIYHLYILKENLL